MFFVRNFQQRWQFGPRWLWLGTCLVVVGWGASCSPDVEPALVQFPGSGGALVVTTGQDECDSICVDEPYYEDEYPEESSSCDQLPADLVLDPPCTEDDLVIEGGCNNIDQWGDFLWPLSQVAIPSPPDLRSVLLGTSGMHHPNGQNGQGGEGGQGALGEQGAQGGEGAQAPSPPWWEFTPHIIPERSADIRPSGFQLLQTGASLQVKLSEILTNPDLPFPPYVQHVSTSTVESYRNTYTIIQLGLVHGQEVLLQQRVILEPGYVCLVR